MATNLHHSKRTRVLCGCAEHGRPERGCHYCAGAGFRDVACALCIDTKRIGDALCWRCVEPDPKRLALGGRLS